MLDHSVIFAAADRPSGIGYSDVFNVAAPFIMFVGETGVMWAAGVIDLPMAQKYVNFHDYTKDCQRGLDRWNERARLSGRSCPTAFSTAASAAPPGCGFRPTAG